MPWLWETVNDVKKECEKDRIKKANEAARNVRINVENHGNSGVAQLHLEKMSMEEQKQAEIDAMREATQATLEDLNDAHYQKKRALAEKSTKEKSRILNEHEAKIKQKEQERDAAAREQSQRTAGLRKDQDQTNNEVGELKKRNLKKQIEEIGKTSELQEKLTDAEKHLSDKHDKEFHKTEKEAYEDRLQVEKNFNAKSEEEYQMTHRATQQVHQITKAALSDNLSLRVNESMSVNIKAVDDEITNAKKLALQIKEGLDSSSIILKAPMGENERSQASFTLKKVKIDLNQLTNNVTSMERKAKKIVDQTRLQEALTKIKKKINATSEPITDVLSETRATKDFNQAPKNFDQAKREKLVKRVMAVINLVENLEQLDTGVIGMQTSILKINEALTNRKEEIENATKQAIEN